MRNHHPKKKTQYVGAMLNKRQKPTRRQSLSPGESDPSGDDVVNRETKQLQPHDEQALWVLRSKAEA